MLIIFRIQSRAYEREGLIESRNLDGILFCALAYSLLMQPVCIWATSPSSSAFARNGVPNELSRSCPQSQGPSWRHCSRVRRQHRKFPSSPAPDGGASIEAGASTGSDGTDGIEKVGRALWQIEGLVK